MLLLGLSVVVLVSAAGHAGSATVVGTSLSASSRVGSSAAASARASRATDRRGVSVVSVTSVAAVRSDPSALPAALSIAIATPATATAAATSTKSPVTAEASKPNAASDSEQAAPRAAAPPSVQTQPSSAGASPSVSAVLYVKHTIAVGETLTSIANAYGVSVATVMVNNPQLGDFNTIKPGQTLQIPNGTNGRLYDVRAGDTLQAISRRFGVDSGKIVAANNLQSADAISNGQRIVVPEDVKVPAKQPVVIARPLVVPNRPPVAHPAAAAAPVAHPAAAPAPRPAVVTPPPAPTAVTIVKRFGWPVTGPITQGFGVPELGVGAPHTGIDIAVPIGTPVHAAGPGTVVFAGGDPCCSYGYYVIVSHPGGLTSLYGHLSRIGVSVGQQLSQGDVVGMSGTTGFSTGPHVHFEVHLNGTLVNPFNYLP